MQSSSQLLETPDVSRCGPCLLAPCAQHLRLRQRTRRSFDPCATGRVGDSGPRGVLAAGSGRACSFGYCTTTHFAAPTLLVHRAQAERRWGRARAVERLVRHIAVARARARRRDCAAGGLVFRARQSTPAVPAHRGAHVRRCGPRRRWRRLRCHRFLDLAPAQTALVARPRSIRNARRGRRVRGGRLVGAVLNRSAYHEVARGYGAAGLLLDDSSKIDAVLAEVKSIAAGSTPVVINVHIAKNEFRKGSISM